MTIQKVMMATINADHPQKGMMDAFRQKFHIQDFDYHAMTRAGRSRQQVNDDFINACGAYQPDWIWMQVQESNIIDPMTIVRLRAILPKTCFSHWMGDCRAGVSQYLSHMCQVTHVTFLSNVGQIPMYCNHAGGIGKVHYLQIGLDWDEDVSGQPDWTPPFRVPDVVFCGGYYGGAFPGSGERVEAVKAIRDAGIDIGVVSPNGWPDNLPVIGSCGVKQQHHVWKRAKVCLNVNHFNDIELYYSDRQIISMASGRPLICKYVPGLEREFQDGVHCLFYRDRNQLVEHVRGLLRDPGLADKIGAAGRAEVMRAHGWSHRIDQILPMIEQFRLVI